MCRDDALAREDPLLLDGHSPPRVLAGDLRRLAIESQRRLEQVDQDQLLQRGKAGRRIERQVARGLPVQIRLDHHGIATHELVAAVAQHAHLRCAELIQHAHVRHAFRQVVAQRAVQRAPQRAPARRHLEQREHVVASRHGVRRQHLTQPRVHLHLGAVARDRAVHEHHEARDVQPHRIDRGRLVAERRRDHRRGLELVARQLRVRLHHREVDARDDVLVGNLAHRIQRQVRDGRHREQQVGHRGEQHQQRRARAVMLHGVRPGMRRRSAQRVVEAPQLRADVHEPQLSCRSALSAEYARMMSFTSRCLTTSSSSR